MKKTLLLLLVFFLSLPLFSHEGSMAGAGKLRVSQTKYFDIIYSEKNLATATILYEKADAVFEELATAYGVEPSFRIPVVITSTVEQFNAYYADSLYNRIVLYDTAQIDDLAVFSETILLTFTHELTHALTYNLKSKGMVIASKLFGDVISSHYLTVTNGMAEGATVSYESSKGEGRLNDSYSLQIIRQAKIENKFPAYSDVKGASDAYPRGAFYYFNGAFAEYLQQNFGMEKYAEFWYRCINGKNITAAGAFKKTYGIKLKNAWKQFEESIVVPEVKAAEPVEAGLAFDFFEQDGSTPSLKNRAGSLYATLCSTENGFVFSDATCNTVYLSKDGKIRKLFSRDNLDTLKASKDGRFLAVGYYTAASPTVKHCAAIYDMQYNRWIDVPGTNYVCPAVVSNGTDYYFVAQNYDPQKYSICVKQLEVNGSKVKDSEENIAKKYFGAEEVPSCFTDLGNGTFAYILKSELEYSVCVSDLLLAQTAEYNAPLERMKLRDLSASDSRLLFSWATKETLPRFGYLDLTDGTFNLSDENISGGVYTPVEYEGHIYYTAQFYKETRLLELASGVIDEVSVVGESHEEDYRVEPDNDMGLADDDMCLADDDTGVASETVLPYKPFSPWRYTFEGLLLPVGTVNYSTPTLGFTYLTSLPWYASVTMVGAGYDISTKSGIFDFSYESGTDTNLLQYRIHPSFAVDKYGFKFVEGSLYAGTSFDFGRISAVSFTAQASAEYGRILKDSKSIYLTTTQLITAAYSNVMRTGPGTYEKAGITFATGVVHSYETQLKPKKELIQHLLDVEFDLSVNVPKLLPIVCVDNFTYNLPTKIKTCFFSMSAETMRLASVNTETVLFGCDIQKAFPGIPALFVNDAILTFGYTGGFDYQSTEDYERNWHLIHTAQYVKLIKNRTIGYQDYFTGKISFGITPNIGSMANSSARTNLYFGIHFGKKENLPKKVFNFGFEAKF